ncbi:MAG: helix-turn-helix domain-containing protein [Acidobacteriaceae bacterium]
MLKIVRTHTYSVPVVMHTLDIIDFLHASKSPARIREIAERTRVSMSTTYRIIRTLVHRGIVSEDLEGGYQLTNRKGSRLRLQRSFDKDDGFTGAPLLEAQSSGQIVAMLELILSHLSRLTE